jgi:hypothetical protein
MRNNIWLLTMAFTSLVLAFPATGVDLPNPLIQPKLNTVTPDIHDITSSENKATSQIQLPPLQGADLSLPPLIERSDQSKTTGFLPSDAQAHIDRIYVALVFGKKAVLKSVPFVPGMPMNNNSLTGSSMMNQSASITSNGAQKNPMLKIKTSTYYIEHGKPFLFYGDVTLIPSINAETGEVELVYKKLGKNIVVFMGSVDNADWEVATKPTDLEKGNSAYIDSVTTSTESQSVVSSSSGSGNVSGSSNPWGTK